MCRIRWEGVLDRPVELFVPVGVDPGAPSYRLLMHFHGASYVPEQA